MNNSLIDRLKSASTIDAASVLASSDLFSEQDVISTTVPMFNVALSGRLDGGFVPGVIQIAGESRNFKTAFALLMASAYLNKYSDGILVYLDSEFGTPKSYFDTFGIDTKRVLHIPVTTVEHLKTEAVNQLKEIKRGEHVIIVVDSIGNIASSKETNDAEADKSSTVDMTRAKALNSFFRIVTPQLSLKNIPMVVINGVYQTMELYSKTITKGGTGAIYSSNVVFIVGRRQIKDGDQLTGYEFVINVAKSRMVKEKAKIIMSVTFDRGIDTYSGLLEVALELGFVIKPKMGWFSKVDKKTGEISGKLYREKDTHNAEFWTLFLTDPVFQDAVSKRYSIATDSIMQVSIVE